MRLIIKNILYISLYLLLTTFAYADDKSALDRFIEKLYMKDFDQNRTLLQFNTGIGETGFPKSTLAEEFSTIYQMDFYYGFYRENNRIDIPNVYYFSSEYAFASNRSSHLKPKSIPLNGISSNAWQFAIGLTNGFGYDDTFIGRSQFYHSGALVLAFTDIEQHTLQTQREEAIDLVNSYDDNEKFGQMWGSGIKIDIIPEIKLGLGYEQTLIYPDIKPNWGKWAGSWMLEIIAQRWYELIEYDLIKQYKEKYPWMVLVYKNAVSIFFYQLRSINSHFPFDSEAPMNYRSFKLGFTFVL